MAQLLKMPSASSNKAVVDILTEKEFTTSHLDTTKKIFDKEHRDTYPGIFYPYGGKFVDFKLVNVDDIIEYESQTKGGHVQVARAFSGNPKDSEIRNDILNNGFKLRCIPLQGEIMGNDKVRIVNGRTRLRFLKEQGVKYVIMAIFEYESTLAFLTSTISFNIKETEPSGNALMKDVIATGQTAIDDGFIKLNSPTVKQDIYDWVIHACGNGAFTPQTIDKIATALYNHKNTRTFVKSWDPKEVTDWMHSHGYSKVGKGNTTLFTSDKDDYLYYVVSHTASMKNIVNAAVILNKEENEDKKLRIIVHTGTLPANVNYSSLSKVFDDYVENHNSKFNQYMQDMREAFYVSTPKDKSSIKLSKRVSCYGALPTLKNIHEMDEFVQI